jgi:UDP-N-acetyl-D-galactosamine dehydrogenase
MKNIYDENNRPVICVIGVGYVGLPLTLALAHKFEVIGFDSNSVRIDQLSRGIDTNGDTKINLQEYSNLIFSSDPSSLSAADFYIVTVPTPIDIYNLPDLSPLKSATELVGKYLSKGNYVVYESTVYPTTTDLFCIPILEEMTGLTVSEGFFVGYSPERVNPGDQIHTIDKIVKIVSGCCLDSALFIEKVYSQIILAGVYRAANIRTAESAKIVENIQRDVNIALVNELSIVFDKLNIKTKDVIDAASTKWNFHPYMPGLVGGHCIGVDPYYWIHKANGLGVSANLIINARKINDSMSKVVVEKFIKMICQVRKPFKDLRILVAGISFKENCSDMRNSKVHDLITGLMEYGIYVDIFDPIVDSESLKLPSGITVISEKKFVNRDPYDGILLAVPHRKILNLLQKKGQELIFDLKSASNLGDECL